MGLAFEAGKQHHFAGFFRAIDWLGGLSGWPAPTLAWAALPYYDGGRKAEAKQLLADAMQKDPTDATVLMCYGGYLSREKRFQESVDYLARALSKQPVDAAWTWRTLGDSYRCMGNWDEAKRCYLESLRYNPSEADAGWAYSGLGHAAAQHKDWAEAARCWREAVARLTREEETWYNLGDALLQSGDYRAAINALRKSLRLGNKKPEWALYDLASCYNQLDDFQQAEAYCEQVLSRDPNDEDAIEMKKELAASRPR